MILGFTGGASTTSSGLTYKGTWDALTNNPFLASGVGTDGDYYIVSVAGTTNLDGITSWGIGDWAIFNGGAWQKIDNSSGAGTVTSVGLSMPSAFSVANSPITGSGSLNVTALGTTSQVVLGDGSLGTLPVTTGFVPYVGATANVDLGTFNLTADHLSLNVNPSGAGYVVGTTQWNNTQGISQTLLKGGNVSLKNGIDLVAYVRNNSGINLLAANYQVVKVTTGIGQNLTVDLAKADNDVNSVDTLGVVIENINNNADGFILTVGEILNINTSGSLQGEIWADGDPIYLSTTTFGALTKVKPNATQGHIVVIGYVIYAHPTQGKIYVKIMNGWEISELHDVYINPLTLVNNNVLAYDSTAQLWENKTITNVIGYTPVNQTTTISTTSPLNGGGDLSANRTLSISQSNTTTNGYLSSTDWNTFNNKQNAITLTTTGTSGLSTFIANTLNIPQYAPLPFIPIINDLEVFRGRTFRFDSTTVDTYAGINTLNNASALAVLPNTTNSGNRYTRIRYYASIVSTGRVTSIRSTDLQWFLSGGFRFISTWRVADTVFGSTCQNFHGLIGTTSEIAVGTVSLIQVSTLTNCIFIGNDGSDANLQIMHNDSAGTCTKIDLGVGFPSNRTAGSVMTQMYSCELYNEVNLTSVKYRVINLESGEIAQGTITTDLPSVTQGLAIQSARVMGTATTNTGQWEQHKWGCSDITENI